MQASTLINPERISVEKPGHDLNFYDYAIGQQVASFAFQWTPVLFLKRGMPKFEGGLNPLEYVISWQGNLEPPPLLIVHNCLSLDAEAGSLSSLCYRWIGINSYKHNALSFCNFSNTLLVEKIN